MELLTVIFLIAGFLYWLDGIRAKEIATENARASCKKVLLEFLDDTVLLKKLRLRRNSLGRLMLYREYQFEFSSTGLHRYKGVVRLLGKFPIDIEMEPYRFDEDE